jgi:hypothetical protein
VLVTPADNASIRLEINLAWTATDRERHKICNYITKREQYRGRNFSNISKNTLTIKGLSYSTKYEGSVSDAINPAVLSPSAPQ